MVSKISKFLTANSMHKGVIAAFSQIAMTFICIHSYALAASPIQVSDFGSNPGNLKMFKYIPDSLKTPAALVVVLHGCKQDSLRFAEKAGWMQVADKLGIALAIPGQKQENNQNNCFNWFNAEDIRRDKG